MKKRIYFILAVSLLSLQSYSQNAKDILFDALNDGVEAKVTLLQNEIRFTDSQAVQIKSIELQFLKEIQKINNCFLCRKKKKTENLKKKREQQLQEIMTRGQYIRYLGGSIDDVKNYPVRVD